ncbi:MAG: hydantoinase B/oxoprolinase family protein [Gammaproteobacteria bacterium]|nr:hydantoinase B/oxoprolinase family protein [Gammaproteobacteria bacterium]
MTNIHWAFWVDRGGTFTDIIAVNQHNEMHSFKLLSEDPDNYEDAVSFGIQRFISQQKKCQGSNSSHLISEIKMGTTVATNALLEQTGEKTVFVTTKGFADLLIIRSQHRQHLFKQNIEREPPLYHSVIEAPERLDSQGKVLEEVRLKELSQKLKIAKEQGCNSVAIALLHSTANPAHEIEIANLAKELGFTTIRMSHQVSPAPKILPRAETTLLDAYLSPVLENYINRIQRKLGEQNSFFMQSNGALTTAQFFSGKDAVLSGPAGGIVAMARTAEAAGFDKVIGFDMGGTSTDVSLYAGEFDNQTENQVAGHYLRVPMLAVHTVAAGGGSKIWFDGKRFRVGPESVGANPGPVSYGKGSELAVTDINVFCGKIRPEYFPNVFGSDGNQPLDVNRCKETFKKLTQDVNQQLNLNYSPEELAQDFLVIAVNAMANAIKTISTRKGIALDEFVLNTFGGAGGQHACLVAEELGMSKVFIHTQSSVLSAYGMGCGFIGTDTQIFIDSKLEQSCIQSLYSKQSNIFEQHKEELPEQSGAVTSRIICWLHYENSELTIPVELQDLTSMQQEFTSAHKQQFGFSLTDSPIIIRTAEYQSNIQQPLRQSEQQKTKHLDIKHHKVWFKNRYLQTPFIPIESVSIGEIIQGPAIIYDKNSTIVLEPNWHAEKINGNHLVLEISSSLRQIKLNDTELTPSRLEIFNNLFMHIAEQMGAVLQNTAQSVNIKERLDFSCAIFDCHGNLIANAPHMPVHLGSMSDSVRHVISNNSSIKPGDSFMLNSPYHGGTHLPDITVISPVFIDQVIRYWVASRGHHADIGGITPGSMPASSTNIAQEGILIDNFKLVDQHQINDTALNELLTEGEHPVRNYQQNLNDLKAQVAANQRGIRELKNAVKTFGEKTVSRYMDYVQDNAEHAIRSAIKELKDGHYQLPLDIGAHIEVTIRKTKADELMIDFSGTSEQQNNNFNAPKSVARAAVLYVLRSLVIDDIPLNEGCLRPVSMTIPESCLLNPKFPAAVVAGNVETSQAVTDAIFAALKLQAGAQGTMNNITFGNQHYQYYETIAGGSGAGNGFNGADAIQTHMTNSRITDPEIVEHRYPVILEAFKIRKGSGGQGLFTGGAGIERCFLFKQPMTVSLLTGNRKHHPFGMNGGEPGASGRNFLIHKGEKESLPSCCERQLDKGDRLLILTPGGGGFGKPES